MILVNERGEILHLTDSIWIFLMTLSEEFGGPSLKELTDFPEMPVGPWIPDEMFRVNAVTARKVSKSLKLFREKSGESFHTSRTTQAELVSTFFFGGGDWFLRNFIGFCAAGKFRVYRGKTLED
jgi:hypothetical protein